MIIGYARVSGSDQNLDMQIKALEAEGCEKIYSEKKSAFSDRPEFGRMMEELREADTLVVWALDRLGRTMFEIFENTVVLNKKGVNLLVLTPRIDTTKPEGKIMFVVMSVLAETEINLKRERARAGIEAARLAGRTGGRPKGLSPEALKTAQRAKKLYMAKNPSYSVKEICEMLKISSRTFYRYLRYLNVPIGTREF